MMKSKDIESRIERYPDDEPDEQELEFNEYYFTANGNIYVITTTASTELIEENVKFYNRVSHSEIADMIELIKDEGFEAKYELLSNGYYKI